jgi:alpha/beta superfamily hydrolase
MSARSPVLKAMFHSGMKEAEEGKASIDDIGSKAMKLLLKFLYSGSLSHEVLDTSVESTETFVELLAAADKYDLTVLLKLSAQALYIRRKPENALDLMQVLRVYKDQVPDVMEDFKQYMIDNVTSVMEKSL